MTSHVPAESGESFVFVVFWPPWRRMFCGGAGRRRFIAPRGAMGRGCCFCWRRACGGIASLGLEAEMVLLLLLLEGVGERGMPAWVTGLK